MLSPGPVLVLVVVDVIFSGSLLDQNLSTCEVKSTAALMFVRCLKVDLPDWSRSDQIIELEFPCVCQTSAGRGAVLPGGSGRHSGPAGTLCIDPLWCWTCRSPRTHDALLWRWCLDSLCTNPGSLSETKDRFRWGCWWAPPQTLMCHWTEPYRTEGSDPIHRKMEAHPQRFHHHQHVTKRDSEEKEEAETACWHIDQCYLTATLWRAGCPSQSGPVTVFLL